MCVCVCACVYNLSYSTDMLYSFRLFHSKYMYNVGVQCVYVIDSVDVCAMLQNVTLFIIVRVIDIYTS